MNGYFSFLVITCWHHLVPLTTPFLMSLFALALPLPPSASYPFYSFIVSHLPMLTFYYLPLNAGFLQGFILTTLSYLLIKYIRPGGISSISLV